MVEPRARILIIGGYGVFGGRLAARFTQEAEIQVWVAGRILAKAEAHCLVHGGKPVALDTARDMKTVFDKIAPDIIIDAAGPFQAYGDDPYRVARAAMNAGAHYLDLADDADFVAGIEILNDAARKARRSIISGVSSVPALSAAAVRALASDMTYIALIDTVILPGNKAPRGLSVVRAILAQAGRPLKMWKAGGWANVKGWGGMGRVSLTDGDHKSLRRWVSYIGAPDLILFPAHFKARNVRFKAGLELTFLHLGLWLISWPVRWKLMRSLAPFARVFHWIASRIESFGTDLGGMRVSVIGRTREGTAIRHDWTLIAGSGDGPNIPSTPAYVLAQKIIAGQIQPGARACLDEPGLEELEAAFSPMDISCTRSQTDAPPLFERVLGEDFSQLPESIRRLHDVAASDAYEGRARIERGDGLFSRLVGAFAGFPPASVDVPVRVEIITTRHGERWTRRFGTRKFRSYLRPGRGEAVMLERFGPVTMQIKLSPSQEGLGYPVIGARLFGIALPRWLVPVSKTSESVDAKGRFVFDVEISMPLTGFMVKYHGWLMPV